MLASLLLQFHCLFEGNAQLFFKKESKERKVKPEQYMRWKESCLSKEYIYILSLFLL